MIVDKLIIIHLFPEKWNQIIFIRIERIKEEKKENIFKKKEKRSAVASTLVKISVYPIKSLIMAGYLVSSC